MTELQAFLLFLQAKVMFPTEGIVEVLLRWIHFLAGITWIGLLYFFNLVNVGFMKKLDGPTKGKVIPALMPSALWWFRWSALVTVLAGFIYWFLILRMEPPATLDGGDVLQIGRQIFVGHSTRTNRAGYDALSAMLQPYGYTVTPVEVREGCLHLVTGATALDGETVLVAPGTIDETPFADYRIVHTPEGEAWAANVIPVGGEIIVAAGYPRTADLISDLGQTVRLTDISQIEKAEGSLTCLSLLFSR